MTFPMRATILGCGSSGGVPRLGGSDGAGDWGACDPVEPKNRRTRCSLLVERPHESTGYAVRENVTSMLIDASPDMRAQLLAARASHIDGVLITHDHADQTHGLDDLRAFAIQARRRLPVYLDRDTGGELLTRFRYCFEQAEGSWYPAILEEKPFRWMARFRANPSLSTARPGPIAADAFLQEHGAVDSLGFRIGDLAYSSDVKGLPPESFAMLEGVRIWIVDALQMTPHGSHAHLDLTLEWIARVRPAQAILTNLHVTMDYCALKALLPVGVEPAHDGMVIEIP